MYAGLCKVPASQLEEKELKAYRIIEQEEMNTLLNQYVAYCRQYLKVSQLIFLGRLWNFASLNIPLLVNGLWSACKYLCGQEQRST
jgi:hypothetical protein